MVHVLLCRLPEFDEEEKLPSTKMQLLSKEFSCSVSPVSVCVLLEGGGGGGGASSVSVKEQTH